MSWAKWVGGGIGAIVGGPVGAAIGAGLGAILDEEEASSSQDNHQETNTIETYPYDFTGLTYYHKEISSYGPGIMISVDIEDNKYTFDDYHLHVRFKHNDNYVKSTLTDFADTDGDVCNGGTLTGAGPFELHFPYICLEQVLYANTLYLECILHKDNTIFAKKEYSISCDEMVEHKYENSLIDGVSLVSYLGQLVLGSQLNPTFIQDIEETFQEHYALNQYGMQALNEGLQESINLNRVKIVNRLREYGNLNHVSVLLEKWLEPCRNLSIDDSLKLKMWTELIAIFKDLGSQNPIEDNLLLNVTTTQTYLSSYRFTSSGTSLEVFFAAKGEITENTIFYVRVLDENGELAYAPKNTDKLYIDDSNTICVVNLPHHEDNNTYFAIITIPVVILPNVYKLRTFTYEKYICSLQESEEPIVLTEHDVYWEIYSLCSLSIMIFDDQLGLTSERVRRIKNTMKDFFELNDQGLKELKKYLKLSKNEPKPFEDILSICQEQCSEGELSRLITILCSMAIENGEYPAHAYELITNITRKLKVSFSYIDEVRNAAQGELKQDNENYVKAYQILELDVGSSFSEVKKAYRTLSRKYHPDSQADLPDHIIQLMASKFQEISGAYETLKSHLDS